MKATNLQELSLPPSIKLDIKQLKIDIYRGRDIIGLDPKFFGIAKGKSDPFVEINYGGVILRTKVVKSSVNPSSLTSSSFQSVDFDSCRISELRESSQLDREGL